MHVVFSPVSQPNFIGLPYNAEADVDGLAGGYRNVSVATCLATDPCADLEKISGKVLKCNTKAVLNA